MSDEQRAVADRVATQVHTQLLGVLGAGKTRTIAAIVWTLRATGNIGRTLVLAPTNNGCKNFAETMSKPGCEVERLRWHTAKSHSARPPHLYEKKQQIAW